MERDDGVSTPTHLDGLEPDNVLTFADWRHPAFLNAFTERCREDGPRGHNWRLGVVNGVFDLCHVGHINLINQAGEYDCESIFLVALLNTDASAARLKGPRRPIVPLAARLWAVAMQPCVMLAAGFDEDTPEQALAALKPDFLFKGGEYALGRVPGAGHCGKVVYLRDTPGVSTSLIEQKIVAAYGRRAAGPRDG